MRVKDVATPVDGLQKQYPHHRLLDELMKPRAASLVVAVTPAPGANDVTVARAVRDTLDKLQTLASGLGRSLHQLRSLGSNHREHQ